jgi:uncharacterized membrane protein YqjE
MRRRFFLLLASKKEATGEKSVVSCNLLITSIVILFIALSLIVLMALIFIAA